MSKNLLLPILNHMLFLKCTSELLGLEYLEIIMVSTFITFSKWQLTIVLHKKIVGYWFDKKSILVLSSLGGHM